MGVDRIRTVTAAGNYNLIDLTTVKSLLNIADTSLDAYLNLLIPQASASVANFCNRKIVVEVVAETIWPQRGPAGSVVRGGMAPLQLSNWPITVVSSVVETDNGIAATLVMYVDFLADDEKGQLIRLDSNGRPCRWRSTQIDIGYSAGFATIPSDVIDATGRLVKAAYWFGNGPGADPGLPPDVVAILDNYRMPVMA